MLQNDMREKKQNEVPVPDSTPEMVTAMIDYIYTGNIPQNINTTAPELIHVAEKYELEILTKACEEALVQEVTNENAVKTLIIVDRYVPMSDTRQKVMEYICDNARSVMKTNDCKQLMKTHSDLASDLFIFLAEKQGDPVAKKKIKLNMPYNSI